MLCPQHDGVRAIHPGPGLVTSDRAWLHPLAGLLLAVCGLALIVAGMSMFSLAPIPWRAVKTVAIAMNGTAEIAGSTPLRLGWEQTRLEGWSYAPERGHSFPTRPRGARPRGGSDLATSAYQATDRVTKVEASQLRQWIGGEGMRRHPVSPFAGWDPREVLEQMASAQHGFWPRPCPCPMLGEATGNR